MLRRCIAYALVCLSAAFVWPAHADTNAACGDIPTMACLAGRSGGQTLYGGTGSGEGLTLRSTSDATRGSIFLVDPTRVGDASAPGSGLTFDVTGRARFNATAPSVTAATTALVSLVPSGFTVDNSSASVIGMQFAGTVGVNTDTSIVSFFTGNALGLVFNNDSDATRTTGPWTGYAVGPQFNVADSTAWNFNDFSTAFPAYAAYRDRAIFQRAGGAGTGTIENYTSFYSAPTIDAGWTATDMRLVWLNDPGGAGSITTLVGLDIPKLTRGSTNIGIRNAATMVETPSTSQVLTSASGTITVDAANVQVSVNVAGVSNLVLTTDAAKIADGVQGQRVCIQNIDTTDTLTFQSGGSSNLQLLRPLRPLTPGDILCLEFNTTVGDWVEQSFSADVAATPVFRAAGAESTGTGNITPALPTGHTTNDLLILFVQSSNESVSCPANWTRIGPMNGTGTAASAGSVRLTLCWKRDNGAESNPTVTDAGDHTYAFIAAFSGVATTGDPFHYLSSTVKSTASTSMSASGGQTSVDNTLVMVAVAHAIDSATANQCTSGANSSLGTLTEQFDDSTSDGTGGGLCMWTGTMNDAGTVAATTATEGSSTADITMAIALVPNVSIQPSLSTRALDVQTFQTPGADTWVKPTGAKTVEIVAIGGGGAGGAGRSAATAAGGGGGGGGAHQRVVLSADQLQATMTVTVGSGGVGGSTKSAATASSVSDNSKTIISAAGGTIGSDAGSGDGGDGGGGGSGGSLVTPVVSASGAAGTQGSGGVGGAGGGNTGGNVTTSFAGGKADWGGGGGGSGATAANTGGVGGSSSLGGGAGGGGDVSGAGGAGGVGGQGCTGGAAHTSATGTGVMTLGSCGGGGGDATTAGGTGAQPGGGGGGGGNATNSGGNGGAGAVTIITTF